MSDGKAVCIDNRRQIFLGVVLVSGLVAPLVNDTRDFTIFVIAVRDGVAPRDCVSLRLVGRIGRITTGIPGRVVAVCGSPLNVNDCIRLATADTQGGDNAGDPAVVFAKVVDIELIAKACSIALGVCHRLQ